MFSESKTASDCHTNTAVQDQRLAIENTGKFETGEIWIIKIPHYCHTLSFTTGREKPKTAQ